MAALTQQEYNYQNSKKLEEVEKKTDFSKVVRTFEDDI